MYTEYQPSHLLVPYIDNYWEFKGNPEYGMRIHILPDGCTDFIFTLGEVANAVEEGSLIMQPYRSYFVGRSTPNLSLMLNPFICLAFVFYLVVCLALQTCLCTSL